jgi:hypothetical protein
MHAISALDQGLLRRALASRKQGQPSPQQEFVPYNENRGHPDNSFSLRLESSRTSLEDTCWTRSQSREHIAKSSWRLALPLDGTDRGTGSLKRPEHQSDVQSAIRRCQPFHFDDCVNRRRLGIHRENWPGKWTVSRPSRCVVRRVTLECAQTPAGVR